VTYDLLWLSLSIALLDWLAIVRQWKKVEYIAGPGVILVLLAWLWVASGYRSDLGWFALGLGFSLAGDIFLMLPKERFIPGLISFLLAHVAYLIGFNRVLPPLNLASLALAVLVGLTAIRLYRPISNGLATSGHENLKGPVLAYSIFISLVLLSALITLVREEWLEETAGLVSSGALLFFISDALLAWNKFVSPVRFGKLAVILTYHSGQVLLILGSAIQLLQ
jgi:uncharacterized membrane protein YhhN